MNNKTIPKFLLLLLLIITTFFAAESFAAVCDVDGDLDVDKNDISVISAARGQTASGPSDPRDADHNGTINVYDARACTNQCTLASCAVALPAPNVVGQTLAAAQSAITGAGLSVGNVDQSPSDTVPSGSVISQNPAAGASVALGSAVNLVVSTGPRTAVPDSLSLTPSQFVIGAGHTIIVTAQVLDNGGNPISPAPNVNYQVQYDPDLTQGTAPVVTGNQIGTSPDTRGSFTVQGTVEGTTVTSQFTFTVIQNATQSRNSGLLVTLAAAQTKLVQNLDVIAKAMENGDTAAIPGAMGELSAAAGSLNVNALSLATVYEPDAGFVPPISKIVGRYPSTAADTNFASLTAQVRTKLQQIKQLLNQPSDNEAADTATLTQYATDLQALFDQLQLDANRPGVYGLINKAADINNLLIKDVPQVMLAVINRVNVQLQQAGLASLQQGHPQTMYAFAGQGGQSPMQMYASTRPVFLLTGLLGYGGHIGELIQKIYGDFLDQVQKMYILLAAQGLLNQFLTQTAQVAGLQTGGSFSFHAYHMFDSIIEMTGLSLAAAQTADVFLIGGAAVDAVDGLIDQLKSIGSIRSIGDLYDFYNGMLDALDDAQEAYDTAHQQPSSVLLTGFDDFGCIASGASRCVELHYDNGFEYVGSGPVNLQPVIILVRTNDPLGAQFGSAIFNFAGQ